MATTAELEKRVAALEEQMASMGTAGVGNPDLEEVREREQRNAARRAELAALAEQEAHFAPETTLGDEVPGLSAAGDGEGKPLELSDTTGDKPEG